MERSAPLLADRQIHVFVGTDEMGPQKRGPNQFVDEFQGVTGRQVPGQIFRRVRLNHRQKKLLADHDLADGYPTGRGGGPWFGQHQSSEGRVDERLPDELHERVCCVVVG